MHLAEDYGIPDGSVGIVDRNRFEGLLRRARDDAYFGLPEWTRDIGYEGARQCKFWVLGTTEFSNAFRHCIDDEAVLGYVDDHRRGQEIRGRPVIDGEEFVRRYARDPSAICVSGARYDTATRYFRGLALLAGARMLNFEQTIRLLAPEAIDYRLADHRSFIVDHIDDYLSLEARLCDDLSKETLRRVTLFHLTTCREYYRHIERPYETLYFRSGLFEVTPNERFVDCGASIGESISNLLTITNFRFDAAWLIEPDHFNVKTLHDVIAKLDRSIPGRVSAKIKLIPAAVGDQVGSVRFRHMGGHGGYVLDVAADREGAIEDAVPVVRLDDVVDSEPTFIKMDIEGSELKGLRGSEELIRRFRPKLAISAYHRASDLVAISAFVLSLRPDYKVGLRHHTPLRWDTCLYFY